MKRSTPFICGLYAVTTIFALCDYANAPTRPKPPAPPPDMANTLIGISVSDARGFLNDYQSGLTKARATEKQKLSPDMIVRDESATIDIPATLTAMGAAQPQVNAELEHSFFADLWNAWTQASEQPSVGNDLKPCAFPDAANDRDRFDKVVTTLASLRQGGVTVAERQFERACLGSIQIPADMQAYDQNRLDALQNNKGFMWGLSARKEKCPEVPVTFKDHKACQEMVQYFSDGLRGVYNLKSIPVYFIPFPSEASLYGLYVPHLKDRPAIIINSNPKSGVVKDRTLLWKTVAEEVRHSADHSWYTIMTRDKRGYDDRRLMHTTYLQLNWVGAYTAHTTNYSAYTNQYLERTAKAYADDVGRRFALVQ